MSTDPVSPEESAPGERTVHDATAGAAARLAEIYNDAVERTTAIWNDQTVTVENRAQWLAGKQAAGIPVLVTLDQDGEVTGYATYGPWRDFDGYRDTVEHSVYVHPDHQGKGLGRALMEELLRRARENGVHVMVAGIEAGNTGSVVLHRKLGFAETGTLHQVGQKFGRWLDLTFMERRLDDAPEPSAGRKPARG